uniref:Elongator complex protein 6 n=2 Tax=Hirondellea gigas TaxID=1518452 RepID=A0A2P2IBB1_9CRUS
MSSLEQVLQSCHVFSTESTCNIAVCESPDTSGQFLITSFLCSHLIAGRRVLFVTLHHTFSHNLAIASKRGTNLLTHHKSGTIKVIEGQKLMTEAAAKALEGQDVSNHPFSFIFNDGEKSLKNLYLLIKKSVYDWRKAETPFTIIIDNLSALFSMGLLNTEINLFISYCNSLLLPMKVKHQGGRDDCKPLGSLIVSTLCDALDTDTVFLSKWLSHTFDATLSLEGLGTGRAADVDGILRIQSWSVKQSCDVPLQKTMHYKVHEKNVNLFAPGMAASVL